MTQTQTANAARETAQIIRQQIGFWNLAAVGARDFLYGKDERGSFIFKASLHPFNKNGERAGRARTMMVKVTCTYSDTYTVEVTYQGRNHFDVVTHFTASDIYADQIGRVILSLDYDGPEVTNPRYWTA